MSEARKTFNHQKPTESEALILPPVRDTTFSDSPSKYSKSSKTTVYDVDQSLSSKLFVILSFSLLLSQAGQELIIPFFPVEIEKKGINNKVTAYILASYNISAILGSYFTDSIIGKLGRRYSILLGMLSEGTGYMLFGINAYIEHKPTYIALAIGARFV